MEVVEEKFKNFIKFLETHVNNPTYIVMLSNISCDQFLQRLKAEQKSPKEITEKMCINFNININQYSAEIKNKFERYLEYFIKVSEIIYK
jgi:hypothetical protein